MTHSEPAAPFARADEAYTFFAIGETAQAAYQPNNFSPGHLGEVPTSDGSWAILCQKVGSWQSRHNVARVRLEVGRRMGDRRYS
jgi:hypothetical protein